MTVTRAGALPGAPYDVAVVGAGVVGSAIARELARHPGLRIALVEARDDVGDGTSKANTAILHTGFDAVPGSLEARLVRDGARRLAAYADEVGIPVEPVGALLVAWDEEQLARLPRLVEKAELCGYHATRIIGPDEVRAREPHLGPGVLGALDVPGESIICPWTTTLAYATQAVRSGVHLHLNCRVEKASRDAHGHALGTSRGVLRARYLVNAAGLHADELDRELGHDDFTVRPRRGQLIVFDKPARRLIRHILLPAPTALGKGVLVAPTVYGNVMIGPTAEDLEDKGATESTAAGLALLRERGRRILPQLLEEEVTAVYAGLRAATEHDDYRIRAHVQERSVTVGGIRSTGLTASMAIAAHVCDLLSDSGLELGPVRDLAALRMPNLGESFPRPHQRADLIAADPEYGTLVCHCERVSRGEIRDALSSTIAPASLDGLRRRTRARGGRCQGFYCGATVRGLFERGVGAPRAVPGSAGTTGRPAEGTPGNEPERPAGDRPGDLRRRDGTAGSAAADGGGGSAADGDRGPAAGVSAGDGSGGSVGDRSGGSVGDGSGGSVRDRSVKDGWGRSVRDRAGEATGDCSRGPSVGDTDGSAGRGGGPDA